MSILLDALKKSEEQRQLGKVPGIHSAASEGPARQSRSQRWALLLLIAVSAAALAWFGWQQFQPQGSVDLPAGETTGLAAEETAAEPVVTVSAPETAAQPAADSPVDGEAAARRTPVETLPAERGRDPAAEAWAAGQEPEPRKSRVNRSFTAFEAAQQAAAEPAEPPASAAAPGSATPAAAQQVAEEAAAPSEPQSASANEGAPAEPRTTKPISYWELPQGIRDSLPELHITVLVYAENPQDRFVLVGGQRLVEKDQYQDGVVLEEIRREGAVFLYRNYRFLVEG